MDELFADMGRKGLVSVEPAVDRREQIFRLVWQHFLATTREYSKEDWLNLVVRYREERN